MAPLVVDDRCGLHLVHHVLYNACGRVSRDDVPYEIELSLVIHDLGHDPVCYSQRHAVHAEVVFYGERVQLPVL